MEGSDDEYSSNSEGRYSDLATDHGATTDADTDFGTDDESVLTMDPAALISSIQSAATSATAAEVRLTGDRVTRA